MSRKCVFSVLPRGMGGRNLNHFGTVEMVENELARVHTESFADFKA